MISRGLFSSRITKPRILCESQIRMGGKVRQEMRGGGCKGGRTNERAEPLNIHVRRWIERIPLNIQPSMAMIKIIPRQGRIVFQSCRDTFSISQWFSNQPTNLRSLMYFIKICRDNYQFFQVSTFKLKKKKKAILFSRDLYFYGYNYFTE